MSAHVPRRSFAAPLVVTLACSSSAGPPTKEPIHDNPPPVQPTPTPDPTAGSDEHHHTMNPPAPSPARNWTVRMTNGKCAAYENDTCPQGQPGQPMPTCNPPPPTEVTCPSGLANGGSVKVERGAGQSVCFIPAAIGGGNCPPNVACNPPPPRQVACPK